MPNYITTASGVHLDPLAPEGALLRIEDIAHALSMLCRGNGHVREFFSVGQHCIWCAEEAAARGLSARVQLACLLHDGAEAYLSDVPSPLKKSMPQYLAAEDRLLELVYETFLGRVTAEELELVDRIDHQILAYDLFYLLNEGEEEKLPPLKTALPYGTGGFPQTEERYLELYRELRKNIK